MQKSGILFYQHQELPTVLGGGQSEELKSHLESPLLYLFSDRMLDIDPPSPPFGHASRQPFSANAADKLGLAFLNKFGYIQTEPITVQLTLLSWGDAQSSIELTPVGNVLFGTGGPVGHQSSEAFYVFSFTGPFLPEPPPHWCKV